MLEPMIKLRENDLTVVASVSKRQTEKSRYSDIYTDTRPSNFKSCGSYPLDVKLYIWQSYLAACYLSRLPSNVIVLALE